jgi:Tol biopolymer transport system component
VTKSRSPNQTTHRWPVFLPDGKHFLYFAGDHNEPQSENSGIYLASLEGKESRRVAHSLAGALYSSGSLVYLRGTSLLAQPFDPSSGRLSGEPVSVAEGVQFDLSTWHGVFSVSDGSVLVYQSGGLGNGNLLVWYDRGGKVLGSPGERANYFGPPRISPDGKRLATQIGDPGDVFVFDVPSGLKTRLTFTLEPVRGAWSPDGSQIAFSSIRKAGRYGIYVKPSNGSAPSRAFSPRPTSVTSSWIEPRRSFSSFVKNIPGQQRHTWLCPWSAITTEGASRSTTARKVRPCSPPIPDGSPIR